MGSSTGKLKSLTAAGAFLSHWLLYLTSVDTFLKEERRRQEKGQRKPV